MKFSLVMATVGRSVEVDRMLGTLARQNYPDVELIVVDQNPDDRVTRVLDKYRDVLNIVHLRSAKGRSLALNVGLRAVTGDVVGFPDDDCWYPDGTLQFVADKLARHPELNGVTGLSMDETGRPSQGRWSTNEEPINRFNVWVCATSYTIFLRKSAVRSARLFNVDLGVGAQSIWGAGEEVDFLLRALKAGHRLRYFPTLRVHHPEPLKVMDENAMSRGRKYNRGFGHVLRLNGLPIHFVLYLIARPIAGCVLSWFRKDRAQARYYWIAASQRLLGWMD